MINVFSRSHMWSTAPHVLLVALAIGAFSLASCDSHNTSERAHSTAEAQLQAQQRVWLPQPLKVRRQRDKTILTPPSNYRFVTQTSDGDVNTRNSLVLNNAPTYDCVCAADRGLDSGCAEQASLGEEGEVVSVTCLTSDPCENCQLTTPAGPEGTIPAAYRGGGFVDIESGVSFTALNADECTSAPPAFAAMFEVPNVRRKLHAFLEGVYDGSPRTQALRASDGRFRAPDGYTFAAISVAGRMAFLPVPDAEASRRQTVRSVTCNESGTCLGKRGEATPVRGFLLSPSTRFASAK